MSEPATADLEALLQALASAEVEFIVVGGVAAVLHGAPVTTVDLGIVHRISVENVRRLLGLLADLEAEVRDPAGRDVALEESLLTGGGQLQLLTRLGPLDLLGALHDGRRFEDLVKHSATIADRGLELRVLDLPTLIEIKTSSGRVRDRLVVPVLLALLEERRGS